MQIKFDVENKYFGIPRRRFGQNFLIDEYVIEKIITAILPKIAQTIVEIGPGHGAITKPLLDSGANLHAIEIDRDLATNLLTKYSEALNNKLNLHQQDALTVNFANFKNTQDLRIVGNLPYNISTPLLFHLLNFSEQICDQHFMLQKEVVEKMVAMPGSAEYGRLSVMLQQRYHMQLLFIVPAAAFSPQPKINSAVVRMIPWPCDHINLQCNYKIFTKIVKLAFAQKRKMLRNSLSDLNALFKSCADFSGINLMRRAQELSVADYRQLTLAITQFSGINTETLEFML